MAKQVIVAPGHVFENLEEAAAFLNVTPGTVSRAIRDIRPISGVPLRYAQRVYVVKMKKQEEWVAAVMDSSNRRYVTVGQSLRKIPKKDVAQVKDITACWYFNSGTELAGRDGSKRSEL